jgi:hypothetical protein
LKQGFTVRKLLKNNKPTIINFDELKIVDGELFGNLYTNRLKNPEELISLLPESFEDREIGMFRGESHPCLRKATESEVIDILSETDLLEISIKRADGIDVKLGQAKEKLEQSIIKPSAKKPIGSKKPIVVEEELEEELEEEELEEELEEEVVVKPVAKKVVKPIAKKPIAKKK